MTSVPSSRPTPIPLEPPVLAQTPAGDWRLSSGIAGREVFFQSRTRLHVGPESFLSALLLPAMAMRRDLACPAAVCEQWLGSIDAARRCAADWWGFSGGAIHAPRRTTTQAVDATGLFFSGGVDAFHALLTSDRRIDKLIFIEGADTALDDARRRRADRRLLEAIAVAKGLELIVVATNLREHPLFRRIGWWDAHGGALAGVAHALRDSVGSVTIAGSVSMQPHGSHPALVPAYSSGRLRLHAHAAGVSRSEKLAALLDDPVALQHLRVCWAHDTAAAGGTLNCGACEKCLRTLVEIEAIRPGAAAALPTFPPGELDSRLRRLKRIPPHLAPLWEQIGAHLNRTPQASPAVRAQVERLVRGAGRQSVLTPKLPNLGIELYRHLRASWSLRLARSAQKKGAEAPL